MLSLKSSYCSSTTTPSSSFTVACSRKASLRFILGGSGLLSKYKWVFHQTFTHVSFRYCLKTLAKYILGAVGSTVFYPLARTFFADS